MKNKMKADLFNLILIAILAICIAVVAIFVDNLALKIIFIIVGVLGIIFYGASLFFSYYVMADNYLLIRNGLAKTKVFYDSVTKVTEGKFGRVYLHKNNFKYYVLPKNKEEFIREFKNRCENCEG